MSKPTLGFVGVGRMGAPMASRLLAAGCAVTVFDTSSTAVQALVAKGARAASSPREVANNADVVFTSVPTPDIVRKVALGEDGIVHGSRVRLYVDLSTTGPRVSAEVGEALAKASRPVVMVDCPVSGGVAGAEKGTLTLMVAGPREAVDEIEPILKELGRIYVCGTKPGQAQMVKVANNLMSVACMAVSCEMLVLGARAGVDPKVMMEVINVSSGRNGAMQDKVPRHILPRTFDFGFSTALSHKDAGLCLDEAERLGVPLIMGGAARQVLTMTKAEFGPDADFTNMIRLFEHWAGVEVKVAAEARPTIGSYRNFRRRFMMTKSESPMFKLGFENRKAVLGAEHVEKSWAAADDFNRPIQELVTEYCWGAIWGRDDLPRKTRSLLNIAMLTALNRPHELKAHVNGALRNGVTVDEIRGVLLQAAIYCGVPAALDSFRVASEAIKGYAAPKDRAGT